MSILGENSAESAAEVVAKRPEGARMDLLPPALADQDTPKPRSDAQEKTLFVINSGILPHSNHERDDIADLLKVVHNPKGVIDHVEEMASFHNDVDPSKLPPVTEAQWRAQQLKIDIHKDLRAALVQELRQSVAATKVEHMLQYVEDANDKLSVMKSLASTLNAIPQKVTMGELEDTGIVQMRALLDLIRFNQTKEYAANPQKQQSPMDKSLQGVGVDAINSYVTDQIGDKTVGDILPDVDEYIRLERARMLFWIDHLVGHKAQPAEPGKPEERIERAGVGALLDRLVGYKVKPAELGRVAVRERIGIVDSKKYDVSDQVWNRLMSIASSGMSTPGSGENEK